MLFKRKPLQWVAKPQIKDEDTEVGFPFNQQAYMLIKADLGHPGDKRILLGL